MKNTAPRFAIALFAVMATWAALAYPFNGHQIGAVSPPPGPPDPPLTAWSLMELGGGGNVSQVDISLAGPRFAVTDCCGGYLWGTGDSRWHQVITQASMPAGKIGLTATGFWATTGVMGLVGAPSDASKAYLYSGGCGSGLNACSLNIQNVYYSGNVDVTNPDALTWCNASAGWASQNDLDASNNEISVAPANPGQFLAADPYDPSHVYVATPNSGLFESFNADAEWAGGACNGSTPTWAALSTTTDIPLSKRGGGRLYPGYAVAFDATGGTVTRNGHVVAKKAYVFTAGQYVTGVTVNNPGSGYGSNIVGGTLTFATNCGVNLVLTVNTDAGGAISDVTDFTAANCAPLPSSSFTGYTVGGGLTTPTPLTATFSITGTSPGVYATTDGGATWTLTPNGPTTIQHIHVSPDAAPGHGGGNVWATDQNGGNPHLWFYNKVAWTSYGAGTGANHYFDVAIDPSNGNNVVSNGSLNSNPGGTGLWVTTSGATGWNSPTFYTGNIISGPTNSDGDAPWQALAMVNSGGPSTSGKELAIDPVGETVIVSAGQGTWKTPFSNGTFPNANFDWVSINKGVQGLVGNFNADVVSRENVWVAAQDEGGCVYSVAIATQSRPWCGAVSQLYNGASHLSFISDISVVNPTFAVGKISADLFVPDWSGYSANGFASSGDYQAPTNSTYNPKDYLPFNRWYSVVPPAALSNNGSGHVRIDLSVATSGAIDSSDLASFTPGNTLADKSIICVASTGNFGQSSGFANPLCYPISKVSPGGVANRYIDLTSYSTGFGGNSATFSAALTAKNYILWVPSKAFTSYWGVGTIQNVTSDAGVVKVTIGANSTITLGSVVCIGAAGWTDSVVTMSGATAVNGCWVINKISGNVFDLVGSTFGTDSYVSGGVVLMDPAPGGTIAAADTANWVLTGANSDMPVCTTNAGVDWTPLLTGASAEFANQSTTTTDTASSGDAFITANNTFSASQIGGFIGYDVKLDSGRWFDFTIASVTGTAGSYHLNFGAGQSIPIGDSLSTIGTKVYVRGSGSFGGIQAAFNVPRRFAVDPVTPNTFYGFNLNAGLLKWTNCNAPTVLLAAANGAGGWSNQAVNNAFIKTAPGENGHLFFSAGPFIGADNSSHPGSNHLQRLCDASNSTGTAQQVYGMFEPYAVGFGAPAPGKNYQTEYVVAWYASDDVQAHGVWGIWESSDDPNHGKTGAGSCLVGSASFTGSISGATLTTSAVTGTIKVGFTLVGAGASVTILAQTNGTTGGAGDYTLSAPTTGSGAMTAVAQTWTNIGTSANGAPNGFPLGWNVRPNDITGDPFVHGLVYFPGSYGVFYTMVP